MMQAPETFSQVLRGFSDAPRISMWLCLAVVVGVAWSTLYALSPHTASGILLVDILKSLCQPAGSPWSLNTLAAGFAMWSAMSLAMMLPTAAPMLSVYLDISEAAAEKDIRVVPAAVLAAGYLTVWLAFSIVAAGLQSLLQANALLTANEALNSEILAGVVLVAAGAYQFSTLKHACLTKCRSPMPYFMANWSEVTSRVFRMGLSQGLNCLGCCWALMLVMFVTGLMNLAWMAATAAVMILEKTLAEPRRLTLGTGAGLIFAGVVFLAKAATG